MEWSDSTDELDLVLQKLQRCKYLFQGLPGLIYTLKLNSKSLIWLEDKLAPETVLSLWQYAAGLLKGGVASLEPLPVS